MILTARDIEKLERVRRLNIINSITGIKPANLIGTCSGAGRANLAIFGSVLHIGSNPPLVGILVRPVDEVRRDTYKNIVETSCFTINHVPQDMVRRAHWTSAKFEEDESEFELCGFTEEHLEDFPAPFVRESRIKLGLRLRETIEIVSNGTILMIGGVEILSLPDDVLSEEGYIDLEASASAGLSGLNGYYRLQRIASFPYAKPEDVIKRKA